MDARAGKGVTFETDSWTYQPNSDHWDEALLPSGMPRRHWRELAVTMGKLGREQLRLRWHIGRQLIQDNGITYNVYGDPRGAERQWELDPVPLVIDSEEWVHLEQAIVQRATLLNAILADLYGEQSLIHQRKLPAALLFGNPGFLRPCYGIKPQGGVYLNTYAADLARAPNGQWWVVADRTQGPSGIGYALENRLVSARTLPGVLNQCHVHPLTHFLEVQREALRALAPGRTANPRIVLLTPGPFNETYFEQSFLARHWGFPLVEGGDLTVRDSRVFMKTLSGLQPVDMVLRRMDDAFCDPLELRGDSLLGIPGFTQAVRSGNVAVANALGSGLTETQAMLAFLPSLCRHLLGEKLRMPSVATWWCGEAGPLQYVREHLNDLVVKPTFWRPGAKTEFPFDMDAAARRDLIARIEAKPEDYIAQERVVLSTAPVYTERGLAPRHIVVRVYACWNGESFSVMPGGLTRVSTSASSTVVSMQSGGGSKDTWLVGAPKEEASQRTFGETSVGTPGASELPSRVADNLFWLGRYVERVEAGVRLVRALLRGVAGQEEFGRFVSLDTTIRLLGSLEYLPEDFPAVAQSEKRIQVENLLSGIIHDPAGLSGLGRSLHHVRRVAWPLKERLSEDTWRVLQELDYEFACSPPIDPDFRLVSEMNLLDRMIVTLSAFTGLLMENTTRGHGWRFLDIGKRIERSIQVIDLLLATLTPDAADTEALLQVLLQIKDSSITYRSRYLTNLRSEFVLELLMTDESNPRSLAFQISTLADHLGDLPGYRLNEVTAPMVIVEHARDRIRLTTVDELAVRSDKGRLDHLAEVLQLIKADLHSLSDSLTARHFSHLTASLLSTAATP